MHCNLSMLHTMLQCHELRSRTCVRAKQFAHLHVLDCNTLSLHWASVICINLSDDWPRASPLQPSARQPRLASCRTPIRAPSCPWAKMPSSPSCWKLPLRTRRHIAIVWDNINMYIIPYINIISYHYTIYYINIIPSRNWLGSPWS